MKRFLLATPLVWLCMSVSPADILEVYDKAYANDATFKLAQIGNRIQKLNNYSAHTQLLPSISFNLPRGASTNRNRVTYPDAMLADPNYQFFVNPATNGVWDERESETLGWSVGASQTLFNISTFISVINSRRQTTSSEYSLTSAEQALIVRVVESYFAVLRTRDALENAVRSEEAIQRQLEQAEQRFEVGLTASTDVLNAQASYDNAIVGRIAAIGDLDVVFEELRVLTGESIGELSRLADDFEIVNPVPNSEEEWVATAMRNNPGILQQEKSYEIQKLNHWGRLLDNVPQVTLSANYNRSERPFQLGEIIAPYDITYESRGFSWGLSFSMQFQNGRGWVQDRISSLNKEQTRLQLIQQRQNIEEQVRRQFRTVVTDVLRAEARRKAIQSSEASLQATVTGYEVGTRNIVEVLNAQQQLFGAQLAYQNTKYDYITGFLRLKQSAGVLSVAEIEALNAFMDNENTVTRVNSLSGN